MNRLLPLVLLMLAGAGPLLAQRPAWQVRLQRPYSLAYGREWDPAWGPGWGVQVERRQPIGNRAGWLVGLEASQAGWGNQVLAKGGLALRVFETGRWGGDVRGYAMPGVALFRPRPLLAYRVGVEGVLAYRVGRRLRLVVGFGVAYADCPAYGRYSAVRTYTELPLFFGVGW